MKRKILLVLWIAAGLLLLCACQQTGALATKLDGYAELVQSELEALPTVTPTPSVTPKPTYIPKITPSPAPTERPAPSLYPMPTVPAELLVSPSPSPSPTPAATPSPIASVLPLPTVPPLPSYAPIPQSVPFDLYTPTPVPTEAPASSSGGGASSAPSATYATGQEIASFALKFVGYDYAYGCESPEEGFDCSGLVYYVYSQYGYALNRTASAQSLNGVHVDHSDIEPGDVLCFYTSGSYIGHAGIYLGNGEYIHAKGTGYGVVVSPLSERGESYEARRILS